MRRLVLFIIFSILLTTITYSQELEIKWQQCFGGSNIENVHDIKKISGGYMLVGGTGSNDGDVSFNHGGWDAWIIKLDSIGNLLWGKTYGCSDGDAWGTIIPTQDNKYYLVGATGSSDGDISYDPYPGSNDVWVAKIDSFGEIIWEKIIGGELIDLMYAGTLTKDGGFAMFGYTGSQTGDVSVNYGMYDMWLVKLNSDGGIEWDKSFGTDDFDWGIDIIQTSDGGFLLGGFSTIGNGGNLSCEPFNNNSEAVVIKLDSIGNIEWQNCYGGSGSDGFSAILETKNGYILSGYGGSSDGDLNGSGWHGEGDVWVIKIDFFGKIIWQKCFGGSMNETPTSVFQTSDDCIVIFAPTQSQNGDITNNHSISEYDNDIWFFKIDSVGEIITQKCFGGVGNEFLWSSSITKNNDSNYVIAAQTNFGPSYDVGCEPHGGLYDEDWWIFEIGFEDTTVLHESLPGSGNLEVYPNPADDWVAFNYKIPSYIDEAVLRITDIEGREIVKFRFDTERGQQLWDVRKVKSGIYLYTLEAGNNIKSGKLIVK